MIQRPHDPVPVRADAVPHGQQIFLRIYIERQMLHGPGRHQTRGPARMGDPGLGLNLAALRSLDKGNRRAVAQLDKAVIGILHAMHPVQRNQLHTDDLGEKLNLLLHVLGTNRQMMHAIR